MLTTSFKIKSLFFTSLNNSNPSPVGKIVSRGSTPSDFAKFLIVSSPDTVGDAISSIPQRDPGGGKSSAIALKDSKPSLFSPLVPVARSVMFAGAAGGI